MLTNVWLVNKSSEKSHQDKEFEIVEFVMHPIGVIHSPFTNKAQTPIQPSRSKAIGTVELFSDFVDGLRDVEVYTIMIPPRVIGVGYNVK